MDVTIIVGTYGDQSWIDLAQRRALPSAYQQGCPVIHIHGETLASARNTGIQAASTQWVMVLDADDELAPGCSRTLLAGDADIRAPQIVTVDRAGRRRRLRGLPNRDIEHLNPLPVCSLARRNQILDVGGFAEWPYWEDWALWLTMVRRGATYQHIPKAVYYQHVRPDSRNRTVRNPRRLHKQIREASW